MIKNDTLVKSRWLKYGFGTGVGAGTAEADLQVIIWCARGLRLEHRAIRGKPGLKGTGVRTFGSASVLKRKQRFGDKVEAGGGGTKRAVSTLLFHQLVFHTWLPLEPSEQLSASCKLAPSASPEGLPLVFPPPHPLPAPEGCLPLPQIL